VGDFCTTGKKSSEVNGGVLGLYEGTPSVPTDNSWLILKFAAFSTSCSLVSSRCLGERGGSTAAGDTPTVEGEAFGELIEG